MLYSINVNHLVLDGCLQVIEKLKFEAVNTL